VALKGKGKRRIVYSFPRVNKCQSAVLGLLYINICMWQKQLQLYRFFKDFGKRTWSSPQRS